MMEHIRQFDWCSTSSSRFFVDEAALDKCNTQKILTNRFCDPLLSSEDEDDTPNVIDWDKVFNNKNAAKVYKMYIPGLRPPPPYPKLSVLTTSQHYQCLKVLCTKYPNVLPELNLPKPSVVDKRAFEVLAELYENEQKEYMEWAKTLWVNQYCIRALRPKPTIETIYEAEFKVKAHRLSSYPKQYDMAAQIPMECSKKEQYDLTLLDNLITVKMTEMPAAQLPQELTKSSTLLRPWPVPEPCHKHPYPFILPTENSVSILPMTEIHRELAHYAAEHCVKFIASENALRCLMEFNRHWTIPLTVCPAFTPDGESCNILVLDSEFTINKEPAMTRTFKAFRHMLENSFIPASEKEKIIHQYRSKEDKSSKNSKEPATNTEDAESSDDEQIGLFIDDYDDDANNSYLYDIEPDKKEADDEIKRIASPSDKNEAIATGNISKEDINDIIGVYNCTCTDSLYEVPPKRSFKKWRIRNRSTLDTIDFIVHCSHKARLKSTELIMEPIPEYQLEVGATAQTPDRIRSLALSLLLRKNASVLNVRVDGLNGDIVSLDTIPAEQFVKDNAESEQVLNVLHTTLSELQGLMPGHYVLQHEPSHGANALLYVSRPNARKLQLDFDSSQMTEADEAKTVKTPPTLTNVLLPTHKHRKTLPCAFTPYENQLAKPTKKPPAKNKAPPQAIKWPKKKNKKRKIKK